MRTLNRPMFRYGGPIKEGVMNGIREPKKNGGKTLLVGQHPKEFKDSEGREQHFLPLIAYGGMALRALPAVYRGFKAAKTFTPGNLGKVGRLKDIFLPGSRYRGMPVRGTTGPSSSLNPFGSAEKLGAAIRQNPLTTLSIPSLATSAVTGGLPVLGGAGKILANFLVPGEKFDPFKGDNKKTEGAVLEKLTTDSIEKVLSPAEEKALAADKKAQAEAAKIAGENFAKAQKEKRIEGYREIMDIKGMNKDAAYNSLIAASQAVLGEGDFKGSLKDGSLINKIIGTTSQAFDKPAKTKDAINSLILKGEIEKNINQGKEGSQMKAAKDFAAAQGISVTQAYKDLGFSKNKDLSENIAIVNKSIGAQGMNTTAVVEGLRMTYPELGIPVVAQTDSQLIDLKKKNELYKNASDAEIFEDLAVKNEIGDGLYVLGTSVFSIKEGKLNQIR